MYGQVPEKSAVRDVEIVTVGSATGQQKGALDGDVLLNKLRGLPQIQQATDSNSTNDQVWTDLTSYSQGVHLPCHAQDASGLPLREQAISPVTAGQLQLDPNLTLNIINTYKVRPWSGLHFVFMQHL